MEKVMEKIKKYWGWATLFAAIFGCFLKIFQYFDYQNDELAETSKLAQQALIWNKDVPVIQRAEVCDLYLSKGYDSYTKKLCENVILQDSSLAMIEMRGEQK